MSVYALVTCVIQRVTCIFYLLFYRLMKEPLPVPTLPYGYGSSPQASMSMYQVPGSVGQQYPQVRTMNFSQSSHESDGR